MTTAVPVKSYIQYQNASKFNNLMAQLTDYLTIPIDEFWYNYFTLDTCDTAGLDNWGRILNQSRTITYQNYDYIFGFDVGESAPTDVKTYPQNFEHGCFFAFNGQTSQLDDEQFRVLLRFAYFNQTIDCSIGACVFVTNYYAQQSGAGHQCKIVESSMSFTYEFNYTLQSWEWILFKINKILPKPAGIDYTVTWI